MNGSFVDNTDEKGNFRLEFSFGTRRVSIRLVDSFSKSFIEKVHTVNFAPGTFGLIYDAVLLMPRPKPVEFTPTIDQSFEINAGKSTLGDLRIPANYVYDQDGNLYEVSMTYILR